MKNINDIEKMFLDMEKQTENKPTKEDLQIKKLQLQIEEIEQKKQEKEQKQTDKEYRLKKNEAWATIFQLFKGIFYIIFIPIALIGFFFIEAAKQAGSGGSKRR